MVVTTMIWWWRQFCQQKSKIFSKNKSPFNWYSLRRRRASSARVGYKIWGLKLLFFIVNDNVDLSSESLILRTRESKHIVIIIIISFHSSCRKKHPTHHNAIMTCKWRPKNGEENKGKINFFPLIRYNFFSLNIHGSEIDAVGKHVQNQFFFAAVCSKTLLLRNTIEPVMREWGCIRRTKVYNLLPVYFVLFWTTENDIREKSLS